jgi:hypothetical protein
MLDIFAGVFRLTPNTTYCFNAYWNYADAVASLFIFIYSYSSQNRPDNFFFFTVIKIYNSHKSEQSNKVQKEIEKFLSDSHYEPLIVSCDEANTGHAKCPIIVMCTNDSRLKDDIDNALSRIKGKPA